VKDEEEKEHERRMEWETDVLPNGKNSEIMQGPDCLGHCMLDGHSTHERVNRVSYFFIYSFNT
jgi:hypothetical protein